MSQKGISSRTAAIIYGFVVIAPVLVLAMIFRAAFPFTIFHREHPKSAVIISNMRQVAYALNSYAVDWDDRFPPASRWERACSPYLKNLVVLQLPTELGSAVHAPGFNESMGGVERSKLDNPVRTVLLFESSSESTNAVGGPSQCAPFSNAGKTVLIFTDGLSKVIEAKRVEEYRWKPIYSSSLPPWDDTKLNGGRKPESR